MKMQEVIKLAKKWNQSQTEYNRTQFINAFNQLTEIKQAEAVEKEAPLSKILVGWSTATRIEMEEEITPYFKRMYSNTFGATHRLTYINYVRKIFEGYRGTCQRRGIVPLSWQDWNRSRPKTNLSTCT